jgi:hypothetical protein
MKRCKTTKMLGTKTAREIVTAIPDNFSGLDCRFGYLEQEGGASLGCWDTTLLDIFDVCQTKGVEDPSGAEGSC